MGLRCCTRVFSSCGDRGLLFVAVCGLLIAVASRCRARALGAWASLVVVRGLSSCGSQALECRLRSCGARALLLRGMWDLPGPGLKPVSPALAGGFLTTAPRGKPPPSVFLSISLVKEAMGRATTNLGLKSHLNFDFSNCFQDSRNPVCHRCISYGIAT